MVVWGHLAFDLTQGPVCSLERVIFTKLDSSDVIFSIPCISHCVILLPHGCSGFDMMIARKLPHDRSSYIGLRTKLPVGTSTGLVLWSDWCLWGFCVSTHFTAYKLRDNLFSPKWTCVEFFRGIRSQLGSVCAEELKQGTVPMWLWPKVNKQSSLH